MRTCKYLFLGHPDAMLYKLYFRNDGRKAFESYLTDTLMTKFLENDHLAKAINQCNSF